MGQFDFLKPDVDAMLGAPAQSSTVLQETAKAIPRVVGGVAQELGEAGQYVSGDRVGGGLRKWGERIQQENAMTPGFVQEHPVISEVGQTAEGVAKMAPYLVAGKLPVVGPAIVGVGLPAVMGAAQGQRSYESGIQNGLNPDEALKASKLPAVVTGAGMAAMGPAIKGVRGLLPKVAEASTARAAGLGLMKSIVPDLAAGTAAGTAVMQAQGASTVAAEKLTGARPGADPWKEVIANPKAWLSAALTGGMFEALTLPGKLAHGEILKEALNRDDVPKSAKAQIILGTSEELAKTDPQTAATWRATELAKLHTNEPIDTAPVDVILPKPAEKAPDLATQKADILEAALGGLETDQTPLDVLHEKGAQEAAAKTDEILAPHAEAAVEAAKTPAEQEADKLISLGETVKKRGEEFDPAVIDALALQGKHLVDRGLETSGSVVRHRFGVEDIPTEPVGGESAAIQETGATSLPAEHPTGDGAVPQDGQDRSVDAGLGGEGGQASGGGGLRDAEARQEVTPLADGGHRYISDNEVIQRKGSQIALGMKDAQGKWSKVAMADQHPAGHFEASAANSESPEAAARLTGHLRGLGMGAEARLGRAGDRHDPPRFSRVAEESAPKKTVKAYKMFRIDPRFPGKLFPLFVNANQEVPLGKWLKAEAGPLTETGKVKSKLGPLAYRPGWHAGDLPLATHIGGKASADSKAPDYRPDTHVWAEVEMPADVDWQGEATRRGTNAAGKVVGVKAHITGQIPEGGHYRYKTNPNMTGEWLIGGAMKVTKVLTDGEVKALNDAAGTADLPRKAPMPDSVVEQFNRFNRTPSPDEILAAKQEVVRRLADAKGLEEAAKQQGITVDDLTTRLEVQLDQYSRVLKGETTYSDMQPRVESAAIKAHLDPIIKGLKVPVEIVDRAADVPGLETSEKFNGVFHDGKIYLNAEHIGSLKEAEQILLDHEIRHAGLREVLGRNFDSILAKVWTDKSSEVRALAEKLGIDWKTKAGKAEAAEEYVVSLAKEGSKSPVWDKVVSTVREFLRKAGFDLKLSDAELRNMVARAGEAMNKPFLGSKGTLFSRVFRGDSVNSDGIGKGSVGDLGKGHYFASEHYMAEPFTDGSDPAHVRAFELGIDKPFDLMDRNIAKDSRWKAMMDTLPPDPEIGVKPRQGLEAWASGKLDTRNPYGFLARSFGQSVETFNDFLAAHGYDGVIDQGIRGISDGGTQYVAFDRTQIEGPLFNRVTTPESSKEDISKLADVAFKTSGVIKFMANKTFRFVFPEDRIIKAALGTYRFTPIHEQLRNLSDFKARQAGASNDIMHDVHTYASEYKKVLPTEELRDNASRLAFLESVYQLDGSRPLSEQWIPEMKSVPDTHPNAPEGATKEVPTNIWAAPKVDGFATAESLEDAYREVKAAEAQLNPAQLKAVRALQDHVREADQMRVNALKEKNNFLFGADSEDARTANDSLDELTRLAGRYMPLTRFGDNLVRVFDANGKRFRMESFESRSGATDFVAQMRKAGYQAELEVRQPYDSKTTSIPASFLDKITRAAEANGLHGEDLDRFVTEYKKQWASTLPDASLRTNEVHRSNVAGFDTNLMRVYEHHMRKFANAVPKIKFGVRVEQAFRDMRNNIDAMSAAPDSNPKTVQELYELHNDLYEKDKMGEGEKINPLVRTLNKAVFLNYLASPSVWLVQWSQPFIIAMPKMAARHGGVTTTAEFFKAAEKFMAGHFSDEKIQDFDRRNGKIADRLLSKMDEAKLETDEAKSAAIRKEINAEYDKLSAVDQELLVQKLMILRGGNDLAFSHDIADDISGATSLDRGLNKLVEKGGFFMRKSETGSRRASNLAAFRLEYAKSKDFSKASDYAMDIIDDTLYNFGTENRAGWMRGNAGRLLGMFQYFRLHTVAKEIQLVRDAIGNQHNEAIRAAGGDQKKIEAAKNAKSEARKELAYQLASTMTIAGAAGTPLAMMASNTATETIWSALQFLFGDPDDKMSLADMADAKAKELLGDDVANLASRGVFSLLDMDISRRVGMGGMANLVSGDPPPGLSGSRRAEWYAARILGPAWGMVSDQMRATDAFNKGDMGGALQYSSPKILKDVLKAFDINENGVSSATGKMLIPPDAVTPWAIALQLGGINPLEVSLAKEDARQISNLSTELNQRRGALLNAYEKADIAKDFDARQEALQAIDKWGKTYPKIAITQMELAASVKRAMDKMSGKETKREQIIKDILAEQTKG